MKRVESDLNQGDSPVFSFDLLRFRRILIATALLCAVLASWFWNNNQAFSILCGAGFFLILFEGLAVFKDVVLGARDSIKILILLLKYPAIIALLYLFMRFNPHSLLPFTFGYLLFFPALLVEVWFSSRSSS